MASHAAIVGALGGLLVLGALASAALPHFEQVAVPAAEASAASPPLPTPTGQISHASSAAPVANRDTEPRLILPELEVPVRTEGLRARHPCAVSEPALPADAAVVPLHRSELFLTGPDIVNADGSLDLVVHLHGDVRARRELVASRQRLALVTLTLPPGESYAPLFAGTALLSQLLEAVETVTTDRFDKTTSVRHVALTAWSAGFVGVRSLLYQPDAHLVDAFALLDGLHAPRHSPDFEAYLAPFAALAERAAAGDSWLFVSHSAIPTEEFSSSSRSARYLVQALGRKPTPIHLDLSPNLRLREHFRLGGLYIRGFAGTSKNAHCAQLLLLRHVLAALGAHWH